MHDGWPRLKFDGPVLLGVEDIQVLEGGTCEATRDLG